MRENGHGIVVASEHFDGKLFKIAFPLNLFSATRCYKHHQNKVKVKGLGRNRSYLAGFFIFSMVLSKSSISWLKKNDLKFFSLT